MFRICSIESMERIRLDSINDFARQGYLVRVTCNACGNVSDRNPIELMRELHERRISLAIDTLEHRMKCAACGARQAIIRPKFPDA